MLIWILIEKICSLFLMMLMGVGLVKLEILKAEDGRTFSVLGLYLIMPCVILSSFQVDYTEEIWSGFLLAIVSSVVIHILMIVLAFFLEKICGLDSLEKASIIYTNAATFIVPLISSMFGKEWVIYTNAFVCVQIVLIWSHGKMLICEQRKPDIKKIFTNLNMLCVFVGIVLFVTKIRFPELIQETMDSVGAVVGPIGMITTGMLLADVDWKKCLRYPKLWMVSSLRLIVMPVIIMMIMKYSRLDTMVHDGKNIILITLLATMTPSAGTITQMALVYRKNMEYACVINVVTTVLCIITMPLMVMLYQLW